MIISASRRTDIPTYYSEWFFNRLKDGFVYVRNPMNIHQISKIPLSPDVVDGIVFWTKNPTPMLNRLDELNQYIYYFQFTLNSYSVDVEPNIPSKNTAICAKSPPDAPTDFYHFFQWITLPWDGSYYRRT